MDPNDVAEVRRLASACPAYQEHERPTGELVALARVVVALAEPKAPERPAQSEHIAQFFAYAHLPEKLQAISKPFCDLAASIIETLPRNPERTVALRKLLEAKDAAVRALIAVLLLLAFTLPAAADAPNDGPVVVTVTAGALATLTGDTDTAITPTAFVDLDGPLALGSESPWLRVYARLGISSEPGEQAAPLTSVATFKAAEVSFGLGRVVGRRHYDAQSQDIATAIVGEWGFSSRLPGGADVPLERLVRHFGMGVRVEERVAGASLTVLYGRDQAAGELGYGQWMVYGALPLVGEDGLVFLVGDATLSLGARDRQRDILRLGLVVSLDRVVERLRKK